MTSMAGNPSPPDVSWYVNSRERDDLINEVRAFATERTSDGRPSIELEDDTVSAGKPFEELMPIMFRCTWPPGAQSRHILILMKTSIPLDDFGIAVNDKFHIIETGGVIRQTVPNWASHNPFGPVAFLPPKLLEIRETVASTLGIDSPPTLGQIIAMMGSGAVGIMDVHVQSIDDACFCALCRRHYQVTDEEKERRKELFRRSFDGIISACGKCRDGRGSEEADAALRAVRSNELRSIIAGLSGASSGSRQT
ncbi:hypothetical protein MMC13_004776 [Lambiella insularis]|nr:hypothetical protein [Lambiella insularis]